jgi:hypothetical protein
MKRGFGDAQPEIHKSYTWPEFRIYGNRSITVGDIVSVATRTFLNFRARRIAAP